MDPQKITELANLLRNNGDKILNSEFTLTLSGSLLRALNDSFTLIADTAEIGPSQAFQVTKSINSKSPVFRDLQLIHDFVQKTTLLCIVHYASDDDFDGTIDINKFRALRRLEVQKANVKQIVGIQPLRAQLQQLICVKSLHSVEDIITHCGGDHSNGFVWNELKIADFSYNSLQTVDSSLEFAQFLQHLNLRHNQLRSVEAVKWLPHLKTLDLSFNRLLFIPQFHVEACKRLQSLNMSNNFVEDLMGITKLDALTDLDLSDNCLLDHSYLLPLSALLTLKFLNLYGNPLHYHPKHRLATAQFLHKNTATVKFILDFETLSKNEKAITGSQQLRHVGSLNRYTTKSSSASIRSGRLSAATHTPASSVGSLRSFKFQDSSASVNALESVESGSAKKHASKMRTVEIEDAVGGDTSTQNEENANANSEETRTTQRQNSMTKSLLVEPNNEHLEAKKHIETMREKYGAEWLQSNNAEMMHSVLGIEAPSNSKNINIDRKKSRQLFNDFLGEFSSLNMPKATNQRDQPLITPINTSTPTNGSFIHIKNLTEPTNSPIKQNELSKNSEGTIYMSMDQGTTTDMSKTDGTLYESAAESAIATLTGANDDTTDEVQAEAPKTNAEDDEGAPDLTNIYSTSAKEEPEVSEPEDDEETYIVYRANHKNAIFLTISSNFLREKDTLTQRTTTKWSLKILESCERIKANTLRINFDTVKVDKQERVYTVEDCLCQELEKKLRDILSQRDLTEMNQTIYRCVNCECQFSHENKLKKFNQSICCPDCRSVFVAEIHDVPKSLERAHTTPDFNLSPASSVKESFIKTPLVVKHNVPSAKGAAAEETASIGSANSLNESSSCSKISNSQSSFDSNQSIAGSSNTDRDNEFQTNCESDVDILSNPSQSSIEVLDQMHNSSRKTSEERRISQIPNLETIDDHSYTQSFIDREFAGLHHQDRSSQQDTAEITVDMAKQSPTKIKSKPPVAGPLANFNLTESSSSGSITDSVCTAYEQAEKAVSTEEATAVKSSEKIATKNLLAEERVAPVNKPNNTNDGNHQTVKSGQSPMKKEDSGISSMFGALFQSTNILMSSSKKLIDAEATSGLAISPSSGSSPYICPPYKFNYTDFNEIDHRLKLYFYQTKFEKDSEHFKWIARGRIYNENTHQLSVGLVVMSTCKCYVMEAYAAEHDDVTKWLRQVISVTVDRLEYIQLLPWKMGLSFRLRDWGGFILVLQDILRTDSLLLYFANNSLPDQCELNYQPEEQIAQRLTAAVAGEKLNMCSLLNGCEVSCENAKRCFNLCGLLATDQHLYLTSGKLGWLSLQTHDDINPDIEVCVTQLMCNLVSVEVSSENEVTMNFLDETQNKYELWKCSFETKENADSCLNAIGQSWEELFGVPLFNA